MASFDKHRNRRVIYNDDADQQFESFRDKSGYSVMDEQSFVDARTTPPRVLYRQDLTHLGWPLDDEILRQLRGGTGIEDVLAGQYRETP